MIHFVIPGKPFGKQRPKVSRGKAYTPAATVAYENLVIMIARQHMPEKPFQGPVKATIHAIMPRPKRLMSSKYPTGSIWRTTKPDGDNVAKAIFDGLEKAGFFATGDQQIAHFEVFSFYAAVGTEARTLVFLEEL